jgi:2-C-methyl-D-erythritol 4-phosphate cytidylyltransferase
MRTAAVIVAAGRGERFGGGVPKQFIDCAGRPLLAHTLTRFCRAGGFAEMILALPDVADLDRRLGGASAWPIPVRAVAGGEDRQASVAAALAVLSGVDLVLVHDGVRPLVPIRVIREVQRAAAAVGAAIAACPCGDTVKEVAEGRVVRTLARTGLVQAQTPQGFRIDLLREAHRRAGEDGIRATDDAALVERLGCPVAIVDSPATNLKVTGPDDLALAEFLIERAGEEA